MFYIGYFLSRSLRLALSIHLAEQINVTGQLLHRVLHLIFQLLLLCRTHPSSESGPNLLKIDGRVVGPDHR